MSQRDVTHGTTASGLPITDDLADKLAERAEAGYDVEVILEQRVSKKGEKNGPTIDELAVVLTTVPAGERQEEQVGFLGS